MQLKNQPPVVKESDYANPITLGGTGGMTPASARIKLGYVATTDVNAANGVAGLNSRGKLDIALHPNPGTAAKDAVTIKGLLVAFAGMETSFTITNYDSFRNYLMAAANGSVTRLDDVIKYTAAAVGVGGFTINGQVFQVPVTTPKAYPPTIQSPVNNATGIGRGLDMVVSNFNTPVPGETLVGCEAQLSLTSDFATVLSTGTGTGVSPNLWTAYKYLPNTKYFLRVRHIGSTAGAGLWSAVTGFTTRADLSFQGITYNNTTQTTASVVHRIMPGMKAGQMSNYAYSVIGTPANVNLQENRVSVVNGVYSIGRFDTNTAAVITDSTFALSALSAYGRWVWLYRRTTNQINNSTEAMGFYERAEDGTLTFRYSFVTGNNNMSGCERIRNNFGTDLYSASSSNGSTLNIQNVLVNEATTPPTFSQSAAFSGARATYGRQYFTLMRFYGNVLFMTGNNSAGGGAVFSSFAIQANRSLTMTQTGVASDGGLMMGDHQSIHDFTTNGLFCYRSQATGAIGDIRIGYVSPAGAITISLATVTSAQMQTDSNAGTLQASSVAAFSSDGETLAIATICINDSVYNVQVLFYERSGNSWVFSKKITVATGNSTTVTSPMDIRFSDNDARVYVTQRSSGTTVGTRITVIE